MCDTAYGKDIPTDVIPHFRLRKSASFIAQCSFLNPGCVDCYDLDPGIYFLKELVVMLERHSHVRNRTLQI